MSAGELDPTFGAGGVVDVAGGAMSAEVEVLPDGRVVTAEEQWTDFDESDVLIVRRFLQDGTPDASFGTGGASMLSGITGMPIDVTELALDSSGRILIAGRFGILRLSANGSLDTTFGGPARGHDDAQAGVALLPGTPNGLAIAPDGRIGIVGTGETFAFATVLTPSGAFDEDFDEGGSIHWGTNQRGIFDRTPTIEYIGTAAAFRATDGALIVGGAVTETLALQDIFRNEKEWVLRGFGPSGGGAEISPGSTDPLPEGVADLAAMPDGSFFMLAIGPENRALLAQRYDAAGAVAMSADVTLPLAGIDRFQGAEIAPLPDGRFYVLARETAAGDGVQLHIARYLADGSLDPTYVGPVALFPEGVEINQGDLAMGDGDDAFILTRQHLNGVNGDALSLRKLDGSGPRLTRNGTLLLGGTSGADEISVTRRFRDGRILAVVNDQARVFLPHLVKRIQIYAHGGDDAVTIGPDVRSAYLHGGDGDDTLTGGDGNDWLQGAVGNDSLTGGLGDDTLEGNAGNDYLLGSAGHDQLFGHGGRDTLLGTRGNDRLFGGPNSADVVSGGEGVDAAADDPLDAYAGVEQLLS